jgi:hypothetical protein
MRPRCDSDRHVNKTGLVENHQGIPTTPRLPRNDDMPIAASTQFPQIITKPLSGADGIVGVGVPVETPDVETGIIEMPRPGLRLVAAHVIPAALTMGENHYPTPLLRPPPEKAVVWHCLMSE